MTEVTRSRARITRSVVAILMVVTFVTVGWFLISPSDPALVPGLVAVHQLGSDGVSGLVAKDSRSLVALCDGQFWELTHGEEARSIGPFPDDDFIGQQAVRWDSGELVFVDIDAIVLLEDDGTVHSKSLIFPGPNRWLPSIAAAGDTISIAMADGGSYVPNLTDHSGIYDIPRAMITGEGDEIIPTQRASFPATVMSAGLSLNAQSWVAAERMSQHTNGSKSKAMFGDGRAVELDGMLGSAVFLNNQQAAITLSHSNAATKGNLFTAEFRVLDVPSDSEKPISVSEPVNLLTHGSVSWIFAVDDVNHRAVVVSELSQGRTVHGVPTKHNQARLSLVDTKSPSMIVSTLTMRSISLDDEYVRPWTSARFSDEGRRLWLATTDGRVLEIDVDAWIADGRIDAEQTTPTWLE